MENLKDLDLEAHGNGVFIKNSSTNIAIITPCGDRGITESRAKLFAAAPDLLKACISALKDVQEINKMLIANGYHGYVLMETELDEVIKKATT